ncbi:MAG: hypothetical protein D6719_12820, partial [Candidatus Dadabacteria bacterium]
MRDFFYNLKLKICALFFTGIETPPSLTAVVKKLSETVVVTQSDSVVIEALINTIAKRAGLSAKKISLTTPTPSGSNDKVLRWLPLYDRKALSMLLNHNPKIRFSTLNIFSSKGPVKSTPTYHYTLLDLLGFVLLSRLHIIYFGTPEPLPSSATNPTRKLRVYFYRNMRLIRGTPFQPLKVQKRLVLSGPDYQRECAILAERMGIATAKIRKLTNNAFYHMAANPRRPLYLLAAQLARYLCYQLFTNIETRGLDQLIPAMKEHTVVLVPLHRSHLDYIVFPYKLYEANLNAPVIAAGDNLSFWPFGFLLRSVGAYFVKRDARQDRVHAMVLKRYVTYLIKRGHLNCFFIEGGRSRSGRMRPPKGGLLSIITSSVLKGQKRDVLFVPVSITYENVIEDKTFGAENTGLSKEKESLRALLKVRKIFGKKYGEVIVTFGEPLSFSKFCETRHGETSQPNERQIVTELGFELTRRIQSQIDLTLTSLVYCSLMLAPHYGLRKQDLIKSITNLAKLARAYSDSDQQVGYTPSLKSFLSGFHSALDDIARGGIVEITDYNNDEVYYVPGNRRFTAAFYKNLTVHYFVIPSLLAITEIMSEKIDLDLLLRFHSIYEYDYLLPPTERFKALIADVVSKLEAMGILTSEGSSMYFASREIGIFIPTLFLPEIEKMFWILSNLKAVENCPLPYNLFIERLQKQYKIGSYLDQVSR